MGKLLIKGEFSNEELDGRLKSRTEELHKVQLPKYMILPHEGFELVRLPSGSVVKKAYDSFYDQKINDFEIECAQIRKFEPLAKKRHSKTRIGALKRLKFHYKKAISVLAPHLAAGWNRWSDNMLDLFLSNKTHKVIWGSGNCGKSQVMAALLYTKWRVNPPGRMVVIACKVVKESGPRVFGYISELHAKAPGSHFHKFQQVSNTDVRAIFCRIYNEKEGKWINGERSCIISLPIKVTAAKTEVGTKELGANLIGRHPSDWLGVAFDEGQELPASLKSDRVFANFYTNENLDVYAWGNPVSVDYNAPETHDMLFKLGAEKLSYPSLRGKLKEANKTGVWGWHDTKVLHITMTDSPKDDPDEKYYMITHPNGQRVQRLWFLGGKDSIEKMSGTLSPDSPTYYSQILGFPYLHVDISRTNGVITPLMVRESRMYTLAWKTPEREMQYFMGVDPAGSGKNHDTSIVVVKMGEMLDGRFGLDFMEGEGCRQVRFQDGKDFIDSTIETMWGLSQEYNIPLDHIGVETHGVGEVIRYALLRHIEGGKWANDFQQGRYFQIVNPTQAVTDRLMFKIVGDMRPATEVVADCITEYWCAVRCGVISRQIFGIPEYILQQFYNRLLKTVGSGRYRLETKEQMKTRGVDSPNDADALSNAVEVARRFGFRYSFTGKGGFSSVYNETFERREKEKIVSERMGIVANLLGLSHNLQRHRVKGKGRGIIST